MSFNSTDAKGHLGKKCWITTFMPFQFASRFLQQRTYQKWDPLDGTRFGPARESRPEAINDGALDWEPSILTGKSRCKEMAEIISTSWCFSSLPRQGRDGKSICFWWCSRHATSGCIKLNWLLRYPLQCIEEVALPALYIRSLGIDMFLRLLWVPASGLLRTARSSVILPCFKRCCHVCKCSCSVALLRSQEIENADESLLEDETHSDLVTLKYHCKHFFPRAKNSIAIEIELVSACSPRAGVFLSMRPKWRWWSGVKEVSKQDLKGLKTTRNSIFGSSLANRLLAQVL